MTKKKILIISIIAILITAITATCIYVFGTYLPEKKAREERLKAVEEYTRAKLNKYEEENATIADVDVVFLGDSLTDLCDLSIYYPEYKALNRGIGGDTTFTLEKRLKISVYDVKPKAVVMLIGANNFKTMFDNYEDILIKLKTNLPDSKIILVSLTAMSGEFWGAHNEIACFNNVRIKKLAEKYNFSYVDAFTPLYDLDTFGIHPSYTTDGGHLTHEGYLVLSSVIKAKLDEVL
ncbi:MAG: hypothetical protein J6B16_03390 [Clostridia bacterium]|nr:hypothetical protein [Clostridia bacterium]